MKIAGFIWLADIVYKLAAKHGIERAEVVELFSNQPRFRFVEYGHREDENVYSATGQTDAGRYLICFFVSKKDCRALILSARNMTRSERKKHGKK